MVASLGLDLLLRLGGIAKCGAVGFWRGFTAELALLAMRPRRPRAMERIGHLPAVILRGRSKDAFLG